MSHDSAAAGLPAACPCRVPVVPPVPAGMAAWVVEWIERTGAEIQFLADSGAYPQAVSAGRVLVSFVESASQWLNSEVSAAEAAAETGRSEETVRRAVRDGRIEDLRSVDRGRVRIRRGDLGAIRKDYDPAADAVTLSAMRKPR